MIVVKSQRPFVEDGRAVVPDYQLVAQRNLKFMLMP